MKKVIKVYALSMALMLSMVFLAAGLGCNNDNKGKSIPDLAGMSQEEAQAALEDAGITLETRTQAGPEDLVGKVVGQNPPPGDIVDEGTPVIIFIGISERVEVPDLVGLTQDEAAAKLADLGLNANPSSQDTDQEGLAGLVLSQDPALGTRLDKQSQVALAIGNYVPATTASSGGSGSGNQGSSSYVTCPFCGGSGTMNVPSPPRMVNCPSCGGYPNSSGCANCGGSGRITLWDGEPTPKTCSTCGGSGHVSR